MMETKYIYDQILNTKDDVNKDKNINEICDVTKDIALKFIELQRKEGYDRAQLEHYLITRLQYEMLYKLNNGIAGK